MPQVGEPVHLNLQLWDGATDKYVRAFLYDDEGASLGTHDLPHVGNGKHLSDNFLMPDVQAVHATYIAYDDAGYTEKNDVYTYGSDLFERSAFLDQIVQSLSGPADLVGFLYDDGSLSGQIESDDNILGLMQDSGDLEGIIIDDELLGILNDNSELQGVVDDC